MSIMLIISCYTGFLNVRRGWQSLNTGPRFYLRLIRRTGWLWIYTSHTTDGRPFKPKKLGPISIHGVPARLSEIWYFHLCLYYYRCNDTFAGGLLVPEGIIRPVVSSPPSGIGDFSRFWLSCCVDPLGFFCPQNFKLFGFPIFRYWAYLVKVFSETRHAH
jgi:hypothetical protein